MDNSIVIYLLQQAYIVDEIGQHKPYFLRRRVLGSERSITRAEWAAAGERGLKPEKVLVMFAPDYKGEEIVQLEVDPAQASRPEILQTYSVYRAYKGANDLLELYVERKTGDATGTEVIPGPRIVVDSEGRYIQDADGRAILVLDNG